MSESATNPLRLEAQYLHEQFFGFCAQEVVLQKYILAHQKKNQFNESQSEQLLVKIIHQRLDVEACELALRRRNHVLTKKIWLLTAICETQPGYFDFLHAKHNISKVNFFTKVIGIAICSLYKMCKGKWLVWRYNLV